MAENEERNEEKEVLDAYYGAKAFVKIKQCLEIGKMLFSFVSLENPLDHIDCYMEAEEFGALLMSDIKTGIMYKKLVEEKAKGDKYPQPVWTSPIGGNATANKGKPVSRYFTIGPGASQEVVLTAFALPAHVNEKGAFIADKGAKPLIRLIVGITYSKLKITQYKWSFLENDYMSKKYCMENMKSSWTQKDKKNNDRNVENGKNTENHNQKPQENNTVHENTSLPQHNEVPRQSVDTSKYPVYELKTLTVIQEFGKYGNMCFKAISKDNKDYPCIITLSDLSLLKKNSRWNEFQENASKNTGIKVKLNIDDNTQNGRLLVKGIV